MNKKTIVADYATDTPDTDTTSDTPDTDATTDTPDTDTPDTDTTDTDTTTDTPDTDITDTDTPDTDTPDTDTTDTDTPDTDTTTDNDDDTVILPAGYLSEGYYATTEKGVKYLQPEFVDSYAKEIAALLSPMKPAVFGRIVKSLKAVQKRTLPFEARQTEVLELLPSAMTLVHQRKAPAALIAVIEANRSAIHTDEDFKAFYRHMAAVSAFLSAPKSEQPHAKS